MSKNKKCCDVHHLCFPKNKWCNGYAKAIRNHWYFMVLIPRQSLHSSIHHQLKSIPCPSGLGAKLAYDELRLLEKRGVLSLDDPIEKRLKLLVALFDCIEQPTAKALLRQLEIVQNYYNPS